MIDPAGSNGPLDVDELAEMLRSKRLAHGFARSAAARRAGISPFTVRERERGHGLETMVDILRYLACIGVRVSFRSEPGMVRDIPITTRRRTE